MKIGRKFSGLWAPQGWINGQIHTDGIWVQWNAHGVVCAWGKGSGPADVWCAPENFFLMPGMVNAHSHLELSGLAGKLLGISNFLDWVNALQSAVKNWNEQAWKESARRGWQECLRNGVTTICDVGNSVEARRELLRCPLRIILHAEVLGLGKERAKQSWENAFQGWDSCEERLRLSLHALYSTSRDLLEKYLQWCKMQGIPCNLHLAEGDAEDLFLRKGLGPMREWLLGAFVKNEKYLPAAGKILHDFFVNIPGGSLVVHGNTLNKGEMEFLAGRNCSLVHCPDSHSWFAHPDFPWSQSREAGLRVVLGSDSLASAQSLDMRAQSRRLLEKGVCSAEQILEMLTRSGASALGLYPQVGDLINGCHGDWVLLSLAQGSPENLAQRALDVDSRICSVGMRGQELCLEL